ncbi:interleukin-4 receptor subunit alpha isoform X2 [Nannospalax galili]|nr:interleukin-4 receptor subunit alpha isoform X2 [Nannospalax galili]
MSGSGRAPAPRKAPRGAAGTQSLPAGCAARGAGAAGTFMSLMGWLRARLLLSVLSVNCLILLWAVGSGSIKVLSEPTCFSDYINTSTCEWQLDGVVNCSSELRLAYWLDFEFPENITCVPKNSASTACMCDDMYTDDLVEADTYQLDLWAGQRLLWQGSFRPSNHVKPRVPGNLMVHTNVSSAWLLTWNNPYPPGNFLHDRLTYMVNVSRADDPEDFTVYNVTYRGANLLLLANTLKSGVSYTAQVRVWAQSFNSTWSEWSPSIKWYNHFQPSLAQRLPLGVGVSCVGILLVCLSCYVCISRVKKMWWDQIPTPARSPLVAIIIQDSKVSLWQKQAQSQEPTKCPRWKSCLTKLLPCLLEHSMKRAAKTGPLQGPGKPAWCPVEVSRTVFRPENVSMSVVQCMEVFEAPGESEEEEEEDLCTLPEDSISDFQEGRAGIVARLTENLFIDLLGPEDRGFDQPALGESCFTLPSESGQDPVPWACFPTGPKEATCWATEQPLHSEPPPGSPTHSTASLACTQVPVITDNPAYRSFSHFQSQSPGPGELAPDPLQAGHLEEGDSPNPGVPCSSGPPMQQTESESWEQILHLSVLRHRAAVPAPASGYREFVQAVREGAAQDPGVAGLGPCRDSGYKAFSSLLTNNSLCRGTAGPEAGNGDGGYKPFQNLIPDPSPSSVPLFTFGLDTEPPPNPPDSPLPSSIPECLGLEPELKGGNVQKAPLPTEPLGDDLGLGIVYSALTCHLCGHLKQHHSQEESGQVRMVASPCCGCCCGDRSPPGSSSGSLDTSPQGLPQEASLTPASRAPSGFSGEGKATGHTQGTKVKGLVSEGAQGVIVS